MVTSALYKKILILVFPKIYPPISARVLRDRESLDKNLLRYSCHGWLIMKSPRLLVGNWIDFYYQQIWLLVFFYFSILATVHSNNLSVVSTLMAYGVMMISGTTLFSRTAFHALEKANLPFTLRGTSKWFRSRFEFFSLWSIMSISLIFTPDVRYATYTNDTPKSMEKPLMTIYYTLDPIYSPHALFLS